MTKYLDSTGLKHVWDKMSEKTNNAKSAAIEAAKNYTDEQINSSNLLGENGKIDSQYLPSYVDDVVEFHECKDVPSIENQTSIAADAKIVYDTNTKSFVAQVGANAQGGLGQSGETKYYSNWSGAEQWGEESVVGGGKKPMKGKIYVETGADDTNNVYRYAGEEAGLVLITNADSALTTEEIENIINAQ